MIEIRILPIRWVMAGGAVCAVGTVVLIVLLMARVTIHRRASILPVGMAGFTGDFCMFTYQLEHGKIVIELCRNPARLRVAVGTIETKASLVRLLLVMAGSLSVLWFRRFG